ncbi:MAG: EMC3/TMCO1 family protein [Candidatus Methanomethylicaceae archaeon]
MALEFFSDLYFSLVTSLSALLGPAKDFPYSALTILIISVGMALISSAVTRAVTDVERMRRRMVEVREWQSAYTKALRSKDQKQIDKLKKKEATIKRAQAEMMREQFKPLFFTMIPFIIFFYLFNGVFGYSQITVAISPIDLPVIGTHFTFWTWYIITSFSFSALIQRIFNLPSASD